MKLTPWMKALVWLGLGGGIGFFAGFRIGYSKDKTEIYADADRYKKEDQRKSEKYLHEMLAQKEQEIQDIRRAAQEALKAQREYFGAKDDEILDDADDSVMEEIPAMPEDPFPDEEEEIRQLHPEDLRPYEIEKYEYDKNPKVYDRIELEYYTEDCVIFDPVREEKWTHPEQLLGIGWKERFYAGHMLPVREIYVRNDTMETLYKITRIDDSFERLYE